MASDLKYIIWWWLIILLFSGLSLPLVFSAFRRFYDRGYIFAKIISLALVTYLTFIYGVFKIFAFSNQAIIFSALLILTANAIYLSRNGNWNIFKQVFKDKLPIIISQELIFLLILILWSWVRGFAPDIEGLEKFMDWGFINSALRTQYLPPTDMWFSGEPINYYYFGHLIFAVLTKISSIPSAVTYNLAIATLAGLMFVSAFSLSSNLTYQWIISRKNKIQKIVGPVFVSGLISALLLTFGGNLHTVYKIAKINILNEGKLTLTKEAILKASETYWYPDATRFIGFDPDVQDKTIHEFPLYSIVVADLHGHLNDIPLVLTIIAILFAFYLSQKDIITKLSPDWQLIFPLSLALSIAFMTNAWDFAVYGLLFGFVGFIYYLSTHQIKHAFFKTLINGLLIIFFWYLFTLPFSLNFNPMAEGIKISDGHTPFYQLFVLYGGFWLISLPLFAYLLIRLVRRRLLNPSDAFVLSLLITATVLIIIPEIIYIKDIYIYEHRRANTMFKLVYQAFMIYSLASGYAFVRINQLLNRLLSRSLYRIVFLLVFTSHMIYPYFAVKSYYGMKEYKGLWGLKFMENLYPDNLKMVDWINKNIQNQPNIIEAVGDSYTTFNQVSVATGLPTVQGWVVHEWLWRGGYDLPAARQADVETFYQALSQPTKSIDFTKLDEAKNVLTKYNVKYIIVASKEFEKYPDINLATLPFVGAKQIFSSGNSFVYQIDL